MSDELPTATRVSDPGSGTSMFAPKTPPWAKDVCRNSRNAC